MNKSKIPNESELVKNTITEKENKNINDKCDINHNDKFSNFFTRFMIMLSERRKSQSKTYFQKPTRKTLFLILAMCSTIMIYYFGSFIFAGEKLSGSKYFLYIPMIIACITALFFNKSKNSLWRFYYAIPLIIIGYTITYFLRNNILIDIGLIMLGLGFGFILIQSVILFLFTFNMSERLITCLALLFFMTSFSFIYAFEVEDVVRYYIIPIVVYFFAYISVFFIKHDELIINDEKDGKLTPSVIVPLIILMFLIISNLGIILAIQENVHTQISIDKTFYSISYYLGFLFSLICIVPVYLFSKRSLAVNIIIFFIALLGSYQLGVLSQLFNTSKFMRQCADAGFGFSFATGMVAILMVIGKTIEDWPNHRVFLIIILFSGSYILMALFLRDAFKNTDLRILYTVMLFISFIIAILITILVLAGFFEPKRKNIVTPVSYISENINKYKVINPDEILTSKEKTIFSLLLEGLTLRQIAGELNMKYDAVNFHYKNIYRKLEVNSKIELFMRYGEDKTKEL